VAADIPNDATGPRAPRPQRAARSRIHRGMTTNGSRSPKVSRTMDDLPTVAFAMVRQYCAAVGEDLHGG